MTTLLRSFAALWVVGCVWLATHKSGYPAHFGRYSTEYLMLLIFVFVAGAVLVLAAIRAGNSPMKFRLNWMRGITALVVPVVIALLVSEGAIRAFDLFGASFYHEITRYILDLEPDAQLVYRHRPGLSKTYQGVPVLINEQALRERSIGRKESAEKRVLLLGDSVTFGWGVEFDATFGYIAERELALRLGVPVRTINSGVCGYNTVQELAFLKRQGKDLAPDMIIVMYVDNDVDQEASDFASMRERWFNPQGASAVLLKYSWLYRLYHHLLPNFTGIDHANRESRVWQSSMRALNEIGDYGAAQHIPVAVFFFRLTPSPLSDRLAEDLASTARTSHISYRDLLPLFANRNIRALTNSLVDIHPNAKGHALIGLAVANAIEPVLRASITIYPSSTAEATAHPR